MKIPYKRFTFTMEAEEEIYLPPYKGSTFRGAFGAQFKKVVCALKKEDCRNCLLRQSCVYALIFESPSPAEGNVLGKVNAIPHPFIIEPPDEKQEKYSRGQPFSAGLILIGKSIQYLPYFIYTFDLLGKNGIGRGRGKCLLQEVYAISPEGNSELIYSAETRKVVSFGEDCIDLEQAILAIANDKTQRHLHNVSQEIALKYLTPTRLKYDGKLTTNPEFHVFVRQLLRRLYLLAHYYCKDKETGRPLPPAVGYHRMLIEKANNVCLKTSDLRWNDWERYSSRQDTRMNLGGFEGEIVYAGDIFLFIPFIKAGEILHVGKGTSFGLGKFIIKTENL